MYSFKILSTLQVRILSSTSSSKLLINDFILNMIMISTLLFVPGKVTWMIHLCLTQKYTYLDNFFHQTVREMRLHKHVARQAKAAGRK